MTALSFYFDHVPDAAKITLDEAQTCAFRECYGPLVLSSAKIGTASWRYYQREVATDPSEYFLARGEAPGRWYGRGLPELGLTPDAMVLEGDLESLLARGLHPGSGARLARRRTDPGGPSRRD